MNKEFLKDNVQGEKEKNVYYEVCKKVRKISKDIGGLMHDEISTSKKLKRKKK